MSKEYGFEYMEFVYENHPTFITRSKLHRYETGLWAKNEPFPCPVPLYQNRDAIKDEAQKQNGLMQPIFWCENIKAAVAVFWCLKSIGTTQIMHFAKHPITATPNYETRNVSTKLELRDKGNLVAPRWWKLDPISVKLNPWDKVSGVVTIPPTNPDEPWIEDTLTSIEYSLGDYMTKRAMTNVYTDQGFLSIYGIVKTEEGEYAIIGKANFQEYFSTGSDGIVGYPPGPINLGEKSIAQTTHASESSEKNWGRGITSTIWRSSYTGQHKIPNTYPTKYVSIHNSYGRFDAWLEFEERKSSPFFNIGY